ncbi:hypothetical protein PHYPSEUDO_007208 [Phytophthora pseudosyringae]|uniref:Uncharacterized protein n=1 Tax=Phytophthora pseudosyringae TaxID=221518 RepID=A0A8T1VM06_9STRA|nr:hypothetical protein PHYPSEUDO_007208 [Phytophthora pseudosyringae]
MRAAAVTGGRHGRDIARRIRSGMLLGRGRVYRTRSGQHTLDCRVGTRLRQPGRCQRRSALACVTNSEARTEQIAAPQPAQFVVALVAVPDHQSIGDHGKRIPGATLPKLQPEPTPGLVPVHRCLRYQAACLSPSAVGVVANRTTTSAMELQYGFRC